MELKQEVVEQCLKHLSIEGMAVWKMDNRWLSGTVNLEAMNEYMSKLPQKTWMCIERNFSKPGGLFLDCQKLDVFLNLIVEESKSEEEISLSFTQFDLFREKAGLMQIVDINPNFIMTRYDYYSRKPCPYMMEDGLVEKVEGEDEVYKYTLEGIVATFREDADAIFPKYIPYILQHRCDKLAEVVRNAITKDVKPINPENVRGIYYGDGWSGLVQVIWSEDFSKEDRQRTDLAVRELFKDDHATFDDQPEVYQISNAIDLYTNMWAQFHNRKVIPRNVDWRKM